MAEVEIKSHNNVVPVQVPDEDGAVVLAGDTVNRAIRVNMVAGGGGPGGGGLTDAELRATPVPISATDLDVRNLVFATDKVDASGTVLGASTNNIGDVDVASITAGDNTIGRVKLTDGTDIADVLDLASSNPLAVAIVDGSGAQITSFGGGTQYTEGDADATITGTAILWEDTSNVLRAVSAAKPLPVTGGGGVQYVTGTVDSAPTGNIILWKSVGAALEAVSSSKPLPVAQSGTATVTGTVSVDGSTVTVNQGLPVAATSRWPVQMTDGTDLALVTAAGEQNVIATAQPGVDIGDVTINNAAGGSAVNVQDGGNSLTVDGAVSIAGNTTATLSNIAASASNVTVLAANANRRGATVVNDSTSVLYLKFGATASATSFTVKMAAGDYYEVPFSYTGILDGIWTVADGSARVTELTA